jgi:hypothetical protein
MKLPVLYDSLSPAERRSVRREYARLQKGNCHHCGQPLSGSASAAVMRKSINLSLFPPGFLDWPVHLHHCRKTGLTIGAVHCHCNAVLWQYHRK